MPLHPWKEQAYPRNSRCQSLSELRQVENSLCCLLGKSCVWIQGRLLDVPNSNSRRSSTQLGAEVCCRFHCRLLSGLMPSGALQANLNSTTVQFGGWSSKQNRHRKDTQGAALSCSISWCGLLQEVRGKAGKRLFTKDTSFCSLYKCYWISRSLSVCSLTVQISDIS